MGSMTMGLPLLAVVIMASLFLGLVCIEFTVLVLGCGNFGNSSYSGVVSFLYDIRYATCFL